MPIYEFKCPKHGKFEKILQYITDIPEKCPKCNQLSDKVSFSVPARRDPRYGIQR